MVIAPSAGKISGPHLADVRVYKQLKIGQTYLILTNICYNLLDFSYAKYAKA